MAPSIERRFQLHSIESGMVASFYDVGYFTFAFPVSFYGGSRLAQKPQWIGIGVLVMGLGSLVFSLPHFLAPSMMSSMSETDTLCHVGGLHGENPCQGATETFFSSYKYIFYFGQFLHGVGATPLYTLGVTLLDDTVSSENSPVYLGIFYAMAVVGPAVGFFIGGESLKQHTELTLKVAELGLSPGSNLWVGAWWIGFLIASIVAVFVAIPILMFPRKLPGADRLRKEKMAAGRTEFVVDSMENTADRLETKITDFPCHLLVLLRNPTFVALTMAAACESGLMAGLAVFLPKFIENQFSLQASMAALLVGSLTVPAGGGGTFLGGYLIRKLKLNICGMIRMCLVAAFASALFSFVFILDCPNVEMAGKTVGYSNTNNITHRLPLWNLTSECNSNCACSEYRYEPVCGADGFMYYSPCHAGCLVERRDKSFVKVFMDCRCLTGFTFKTRNYAGRQWNVQAVGKTCDNHCKYLNIYILFCIGFAYLTLLDSVPSMSATLRSVPESQRSLALGLQIMYVKLFGTIPAPVIFGRFFDKTCRLWQKACPMQQSQGNCRFYDNYWMSRYMLLAALTGKTMTFVYYGMAYYNYKSPDGQLCYDTEKGKPCPSEEVEDVAADEMLGGEDDVADEFATLEKGRKRRRNPASGKG
ncbi:unnamed protein product [Notodromas monacha]|uniref:Solute carrier organic anion transporter family member n=1 Tax=Notodromas monacha TaxID=399045 RepID=A0A7R9BWH7_9CRUS|nr:unnamed protein product [Notodromas monacha]CAG0923024.1 unnamed protein product [Notodromas monacha]